MYVFLLFVCFLFFNIISSVQLLSHVWLFVIPWTATCQASLSMNSQSLLKLMSIESVMPSNHLILCHSLLLPSIFPGIKVFSNESILCISWPRYWSFSFSISPFSEYSGLISFRIDWLDFLAIQGSLKNLLQNMVQKHQFFSAQLSLYITEAVINTDANLHLLFLFYIILFVYFWLCWVFTALQVFSSCGEQELLSSCSGRASHCGGFSCCRAQVLGARASAVAAHGLSSCNPQALRAQAQYYWYTGLVACGIVPDQRCNLCLLHW